MFEYRQDGDFTLLKDELKRIKDSGNYFLSGHTVKQFSLSVHLKPFIYVYLIYLFLTIRFRFAFGNFMKH